MSLLFPVVARYARLFGGDPDPAGRAEWRYLQAAVECGDRVVDVGGGPGKLAAYLSRKAAQVVVLDREMTELSGADSSIYVGSLRRLVATRPNERVQAVYGDALSFPVREASLDVVVSSQLLEHIAAIRRQDFFRECQRCLKPGGVAAISTPNAEFLGRRGFRLSRWARRVIPARYTERMPRSLRGAWLVETVDDWEARVGHYGHGCAPADLVNDARKHGLALVDSRCIHTELTWFWLQLYFVFPLLALLATPLVRAAYWLERTLPPRTGANYMATFRKTADGRPS